MNLSFCRTKIQIHLSELKETNKHFNYHLAYNIPIRVLSFSFVTIDFTAVSSKVCASYNACDVGLFLKNQMDLECVNICFRKRTLNLFHMAAAAAAAAAATQAERRARDRYQRRKQQEEERRKEVLVFFLSLFLRYIIVVAKPRLKLTSYPTGPFTIIVPNNQEIGLIYFV